LLRPRAERIAIPYEGRRLDGHLLRPLEAGPRPPLIFNGGYDSTAEEGYFMSGAAALARGYACLLFDGAGQGGAIIEDGLTFRPDWEAAARGFYSTRSPSTGSTRRWLYRQPRLTRKQPRHQLVGVVLAQRGADQGARVERRQEIVQHVRQRRRFFAASSGAIEHGADLVEVALQRHASASALRAGGRQEGGEERRAARTLEARDNVARPLAEVAGQRSGVGQPILAQQFLDCNFPHQRAHVAPAAIEAGRGDACPTRHIRHTDDSVATLRHQGGDRFESRGFGARGATAGTRLGRHGDPAMPPLMQN